MGMWLKLMLVVLAISGALPGVAGRADAALAADSERLARAKDLIADEQWRRAITELRAASVDPTEPARDEVAFWLAHSLYQAGDAAAALEMVQQLESRFPRSRWVFPARSLKLEIAHRMNRSDVLWHAAAPPAPPAPPAPDAVRPARPAAPATPHAPPRPPVVAPAPPAPEPLPRPRRQWVRADEMDAVSLATEEVDLRIQALGSLMHVEPARAVPVLKDVALTTPDMEQARLAIFVLMQSDRVDARSAVAEIAKRGPEPVTLAAVRELGLVASPDAARLLAQLYSSGSLPVKAQVIRSLGRAGQARSLVRIARTESERALKENAVVALGQAGARTQLAALYRQQADLRAAVIPALFTAAGEEELIAIATTERDAALRTEAVARLKLFGTPRARAFLEGRR